MTTLVTATAIAVAEPTKEAKKVRATALASGKWSEGRLMVLFVITTVLIVLATLQVHALVLDSIPAPAPVSGDLLGLSIAEPLNID